jgi:hypothetical protein
MAAGHRRDGSRGSWAARRRHAGRHVNYGRVRYGRIRALIHAEAWHRRRTARADRRHLRAALDRRDAQAQSGLTWPADDRKAEPRGQRS